MHLLSIYFIIYNSNYTDYKWLKDWFRKNAGGFYVAILKIKR